MLRLSSVQAFVVCVAISFAIAITLHLAIFGKWGWFGDFLSISAGTLYLKFCHVSIPSNRQGIQRFFGRQNGMVWKEGNLHFIPIPFFDIWKSVSVEQLSITAAARARSSDEQHIMVLGTCIVTPKNVFRFNKVAPDSRERALLSFAMLEMGKYIRENSRRTLLHYSSHAFRAEMEAPYGCDVEFQMNETIDINDTNRNQFDAIARMKGKGSMEEVIAEIKKSFSSFSDEQVYAMYGSLIDINPKVMTHIIKGNGGLVLSQNS